MGCALRRRRGEKSLWRLKVGVKFKLQKITKVENSPPSPVPSNYSTTAQLSRLFHTQLFAITEAICCHNFLYLKRNEGIPPMHWHRCEVFFPPLSSLILCVPMRAISFHTWIGLSAPSAKQCGRYLSGRDVARNLAASWRTSRLEMRLYSPCRRPSA